MMVAWLRRLAANRWGKPSQASTQELWTALDRSQERGWRQHGLVVSTVTDTTQPVPRSNSMTRTRVKTDTPHP